MTIKELIEVLQRMPQEVEVWTKRDTDYGVIDEKVTEIYIDYDGSCTIE